jgi:hypothetical protein
MFPGFAAAVPAPAGRGVVSPGALPITTLLLTTGSLLLPLPSRARRVM